MKKKSYDLIGDIHGRFDKLAPLMQALGYRHDGKSLVNSDPNRTAIFLGDLIDPKTDSVPNGTREVLQTVRDMTLAGTAECILGNHEFNFIAYRSKDKDGGFIRPHSEKNIKMHAGTEAAFRDHPRELEKTFLPWLKTLPFYLDLPEIRAVHACWNPDSIDFLAGKTLADLDFLIECSTRNTTAYQAVETTLKGMEIALPKGCTFLDHSGTRRKKIRARWWDNRPCEPTIRGMVFPPKPSLPDTRIVDVEIARLPGYSIQEKPLFFGHYYKTATEYIFGDYRPEDQNLLCLDFSAATDGPLASYHWREGEQGLLPENLHLTDPRKPLGLITAFLDTMPSPHFECASAWQNLIHASEDCPSVPRDPYEAWITYVLKILAPSTVTALWEVKTPEGQKLLNDFDENQQGFDEASGQPAHPPIDELIDDLSRIFLDDLRCRAEDLCVLREDCLFCFEESFEEEEEIDAEAEDSLYFLGFISNRDTVDLNAPIIPTSEGFFDTYEEAKAAADKINQEAREREGMFADLILVQKGPAP